MKYIHDLDASKEIVHEVFLKLWENRESIDLSKSLKSYLFTSVHNRILNYLRDRKKFNPDKTEWERLKDRGAADIEEGMKETELKQRIEAALKSLPEKCREIFVMNRMEEMKYQEIADKLGISLKTVEAQMSKALKIMREKLSDYLLLAILLIVKYLRF